MCDLPDIDGAWMPDGLDDSNGSDGIDSSYDSDWFEDYSLLFSSLIFSWKDAIYYPTILVLCYFAITYESQIEALQGTTLLGIFGYPIYSLVMTLFRRRNIQKPK
jgi:hypothetical protein